MFSEWIKLPQNHSHCPAAHSTYPNPGSNRLFAFDLIQPYFSFWHFLCPFPLPCAAGLGGCCLIHNPQINSLCICFSLLEYCLLVFTIKKKNCLEALFKKVALMTSYIVFTQVRNFILFLQNVCIYLFIFGCARSSLLLRLFSTCSEWGLLFSCGAWASHFDGFSCCGGMQDCSTWPQ